MFVLPQEQFHVLGASGLFVPQFEQKLSVMPWLPQGQFQKETGSGFLLPQLGQKFPVKLLLPQEQFHVAVES